MKNKRVLITGGAGYIGSQLTTYLLQKGFKVTVFDSLFYGQISLLHCCNHTGFSFVKGDIRDIAKTKELLLSHDIVIPLAAIVGAPACKEQAVISEQINLEAPKLMLNYLSRNQIVVFPTTNSGYGIGQEGVSCTEESPLSPISDYGRHKVEIESQFLSRNIGTSLRLATVFGVSPRMRLDLLVNNFCYCAYKNGYIVIYEGHFKRNFIHILDVCKAFLFAIENYDAMVGQPFNVGLSSANISKSELAALVKRFVPQFFVHHASIGSDGDKRNYIVSNEKLERMGWEPEYSIEDGIRELLGAFPLLQPSTATFSNA